MITPNTQFPPTPPGPNTAKVLQVANALKLSYLGRINSELSNSSGVGFPTEPTITIKLILLIFDHVKL